MCRAHGLVFNDTMCRNGPGDHLLKHPIVPPGHVYVCSFHCIVILIRCNILYEEKNSIIFDLLYSRLQSACQGGSRENINGILTTVHNTSLNISYVTSLPHVLHVNEH